MSNGPEGSQDLSADDRLLLAAMEKEIREMGGRPVQLNVDWGVAWAILGAIQLACRHPEFQGHARKVVEGFARYLQENITPGPACKLIAERGWAGAEQLGDIAVARMDEAEPGEYGPLSRAEAPSSKDQAPTEGAP